MSRPTLEETFPYGEHAGVQLPDDPREIDKQKIGKWLRERREAAGIHRPDVPELIGRGYKTVMNTELGKGPESNVVLIRFLKLLGLLPTAPMTLPQLGRLAELEERVVGLDQKFDKMADERQRAADAIAESLQRILDRLDELDPPGEEPNRESHR